MYQYSLKYFQQLFNMCIETSEKSKDLEQRLKTLLQVSVETVYTNIARGLFEEHKLMFSFMLCVDIMREEGLIAIEEWNFFLRGAAGVDKERPEKPAVPWLTDAQWKVCCDLEASVPNLKGIMKDYVSTQVFVKRGDIKVHQVLRKIESAYNMVTCVGVPSNIFI